MKKILVLFFLIAGIISAQDVDSVKVSSDSTTTAYLLESGYSLGEIWFSSGFNSTTVYINYGNATDTNNCMLTQDVDGTRIGATSISAPCRVVLTPSKVFTGRSFEFVVNGSDAGAYIKFKSIKILP